MTEMEFFVKRLKEKNQKDLCSFGHKIGWLQIAQIAALAAGDFKNQENEKEALRGRPQSEIIENEVYKLKKSLGL